MKPLDDKKIMEVNVELENRLNKERSEWNEKVITLVNMMKENRKLPESQVFQLSYRQQVQERIAVYKILVEKKQGELDKQTVSRYREYIMNYDIKLNDKEKSAFVSADCTALKQQLNMIKIQINFFEECVKTLDNFGFAIKNKIEILSQQLA